MKKLISLLLLAVMLVAFTSCKNKEEQATEAPKNTQTNEVSSSVNNENPVIEEEFTVSETDPSEWSEEEVIEFYKASAARSQSKVKSVQKMTLKKLSVNDGDGALGKFVDFVTPFFISALEKNSTEFDGITGGYDKLQLSDAKSVKAYKEGKYTVVEITLKEQTDGIHADSNSGSVGHAISVVGDISVVEKELPQFKIGFDKADISLKYSNPKLKVKINNEGIIESGVWSYTVCINVKNLRVDARKVPVGATVDKGYGEVDYIITVG